MPEKSTTTLSIDACYLVLASPLQQNLWLFHNHHVQLCCPNHSMILENRHSPLHLRRWPPAVLGLRRSIPLADLEPEYPNKDMEMKIII
jgi:hypothetical protein